MAVRKKILLFGAWTGFMVILWILFMNMQEEHILRDFLKQSWYLVCFVIPSACLLIPFAAGFIYKSPAKKIFICMAVCLFLFVLLSKGPLTASRLYFQSFSASKWADYPNERYLMMDDFNRTYSLIGMREDDLEQLLGSADTRDGEIERYQLEDAERPRFLILEYSHGKVQNAYIHQELSENLIQRQ